MSTLEGVALLLASDGVGDYATDRALDPELTPITVGGLPETPGDAIMLNTYEGPEPDSRNGIEYPRLQVWTRAADPLDALALDAAVYTSLQARSGVTLEDGRLLQDCYALQSEPMPMGRDANGMWQYARNYQLDVEPAGA